MAVEHRVGEQCEDQIIESQGPHPLQLRHRGLVVGRQQGSRGACGGGGATASTKPAKTTTTSPTSIGTGKTALGTILVDSRDSWTTTDVSLSTGHVDWILGGKGSTFTQVAGPGQTLNDANDLFAWQHDPEWLGNDEISIFDDDFKPAELAPRRVRERPISLGIDSQETCRHRIWPRLAMRQYEKERDARANTKAGVGSAFTRDVLLASGGACHLVVAHPAQGSVSP